jgi:hypothetical protein
MSNGWVLQRTLSPVTSRPVCQRGVTPSTSEVADRPSATQQAPIKILFFLKQKRKQDDVHELSIFKVVGN